MTVKNSFISYKNKNKNTVHLLKLIYTFPIGFKSVIVIIDLTKEISGPSQSEIIEIL